MKLDPRMIVQFAVIAEEASFTRAAERLKVAQPWLSARLRKFEDQIGFSLFVRNTRNVTLTERGAELLQAARSVYASVAAAEALATQLGRRDERRLRLGTPPYSNQIRHRRDMVDHFCSVYRDVIVELDVGWTPTLIERVRSGDLDVAFALGHIEHSDLESVVLCQVGVNLLMSGSNALAAQSALTAEDLRGHSVAVFTRALHPELFDELFTPLREAEVELIQVPELNGGVLERLHGSEHLIFAQFNLLEDGINDAKIVRRPLEIKEKLPFSLVRRKGNVAVISRTFWNLAL